MFQFFKFTAIAKHRRTLGRGQRCGRVEFLESRCLLAFAPITPDYSGISNSTTNSGVFASGDNSSELAIPSFESNPRRQETPPAQEIPPRKDIPPAQETPPTKELPPYIPPAGEAGKPEEPSRNPIPDSPRQEPLPPPVDDGLDESDPDGLIDIGKSTPNTVPADLSPSDVADQRETRDVLQMLSTLQYSVDQRSPGDRLEGRLQDTAFQALFRDLAEQLNQRQDDNERDGGAVAIAADEVATELQAARAWEPSYDLLRDVSVQLETSSGRYQAFEVSTFGEEMLPTAEAEHALLPVPPMTSFESSWSGEELPVADDAAADTPEPLPATGAPLSAAPPVDESRKITWTSAVAIVTLGIVLQIFRDWKLEGLRTQAAVAWQQWVGSPTWFRRRSSATRQQDHSLPQTAYAQQSRVTEQ